MKIAKHCHEECASDVIIAQGALLGLVVDDCLEITNCFAFPKSVDESINDGKFFFTLILIFLINGTDFICTFFFNRNHIITLNVRCVYIIFFHWNTILNNLLIINY